VLIVSGLKIIAMWDNRTNVLAPFVQGNAQSTILLVKVDHTLLHTEYVVV